MEREEAAERFVQRIVSELGVTGHQQLVDAVEKGIPRNIYGGLSKWYLEQNGENQQQIRALIKEAVNFTIFGLLSLLDGVAGHERIGDKPANYALFLEVYSNYTTYTQSKAEYNVRINPYNINGELLHDIFRRVESEQQSDS